MGSLSASLNIALQSMLAEQGAIETTSNNIANVNTPGYARQRANLDENPPVQIGGVTFGAGVNLASVSSLRDSILDLRVNQETQQQGRLDAFLSGGQQIQALFNETAGTGLQAPLTAFFSSLSQLSSNPSDLNARQAVITAAQNLARAFNQSSTQLNTIQRSVDLSVSQSVTQINTLTAQIAKVNAQVSAATASGQNPGPFIDQRQQFLNQLSNLIGISQIDAGGGSLTITTGNGAPLVVAAQSFQLTASPNAASFLQVFAQGTNITRQITEGQLAGQLQIRDQEIPSVLTALDTLASNLSAAVNTQHQVGFDLNGAPGGNLFSIPPAVGTGAASSMAAVISDPKKLAASLDGTPGDNANANALVALQNQALVNGQTPLSFYSNTIFKIGSDVSNAQANQQAGGLVLQQLQDLQGGISGVDINEEAANLIRFQNAYQASAQVSSVINTLLQATINMVS